ncbi:MAG: DUF3604 domain-containing protein [Myxococcota bacterium]
MSAAAGRIGLLVTFLCLSGAAPGVGPARADGGERQLLWGDTHVHTSYSFDAFLNGNQSADPDVAYRYAKGQPVIHPYNRTRVRIQTPLDFLVVSDHAEFYGGIRDIYLEGVQDPDANFLRKLVYWYYVRDVRKAIDEGRGPEYFAGLLPVAEDPVEAAARWSEETGAKTPPGAETSARNAWERLRAAADRHHEPGRFTTFLGWEWSSVPGGANLHRVVVSDADGESAQGFLPFSSSDSPYPEDLWAWLGKTSAETGVRFLAIPHNSNISKGQMFAEKTLRGEAIGADYARLRSRWEPVVETTQIKGDSETHPDLSPEDPFADFEIYPWYIQQHRGGYRAQPGDFIRSALRTGLALESKVGVNPYRFGVIGSTDTHTALASAEEPNFWGKMAYDSVPENKQGKTIADGPVGWSMSASGIAAVYAERNDRSSILDAFERREVYATTGPRIRVRFFGGWSFTPGDLAADPARVGYAKGVPMGGVLAPAASKAGAPTFLVTAQKDPKSANLDRVQIVKGWLDAAGETHERVFDVAWSEGREVGADGVLEPVGNSVDLARATWTDDIGTPELSAVWADPEFDASQSAFYYVRVLQIPTPRHALYDAVALGLEAPTVGPSVIQERAYTSAIWYAP